MTQRWYDKIPCPVCSVLYTRRGLPTHSNSRRCEQNVALVLVKNQIEEIETTICTGKERIPTVFARALERRNLKEWSGLLCTQTKIFSTTDGDWERGQEYWCDDWLAYLYRAYNLDKSLKIYDDIARICTLSPQDQEMHKQLMLLKYTDIDG